MLIGADSGVALASTRADIGPSVPGWGDDERISGDTRRQWIDEGYVVLRSVYDKSAMENYREVVAAQRALIDDGKDEHGYGDRIGQLHQKHPGLLELAGDERVLTFLSWAFGDEPVVFGSLNFDRGTEQEAHIDAIFFYPEPSYSMAGVWVALEDVHPDAGPLFYIPGSHRWPFARGEDVVRTRPDLAARRVSAGPNAGGADAAELVGALGHAWTEDLKTAEARAGAGRRLLPVNAGDVVIWHSLLAHGGSPRRDVARSRRSVVFHYIGASTSLYTSEQFFLVDRHNLQSKPRQPMDLAVYKNLRYMRYPYFVSYSADGQIIHDL